jgi:hypothetical protein
MKLRYKKINRPALAFFAILFCAFQTLSGAGLPMVKDVEWQPFSAQVNRLIEAADYLGTPFSAEEKKGIDMAVKGNDTAAASERVQEILDAHCLFSVNINPEMRVKVAPGPAKPELVEQGWRQFLVKVNNESGTTAELRAVSPNAISLFESGSASTPSDKFFRKRGESDPLLNPIDRWLDLSMYNRQPLKKDLSGLKLEYAIVQLYSRDAGKREAKISFNVGQGTQDLGYRNDVDLLFDCLPAHPVTLRVRDENNQPTTASFLIRDAQGRVYPSPAKRLAPDFAFHPQVYRADGETIKLPKGDYTIELSRGPESITKKETISVNEETRQVSFKAERWIDPSKLGWWSGDHHIHAAGCAHYVKPTEGVLAQDMIRHCIGEDLKIGANLTWGPCFDYQKQFFCGAIDKVSKYPYLLRYDIEVSGFGSHQSGHLVLLRLKEEIYPGGESKDHWPTLCLNTLRWAKKQGAVCGPAHSGWGLQTDPFWATTNLLTELDANHDDRLDAAEAAKGLLPVSFATLDANGDGSLTRAELNAGLSRAVEQLPNFVLPFFNGIGANEYVVDVTHQVPGPDGKLTPAVDFISTVDTPHLMELNIWYHTLNAGFRTRISGETDFPCIYGERVGLGRSYVKLDGKLDYDQWCEGIRQGRNYVSDGKSHLLEFQANDLPVGEKGSEIRLPQSGTIHITARAAAYLDEKPNQALRNARFYWNLEKARLGETRQVPVEVIVNGYPVAQKKIEADGKIRDLSFDVKVDRSSWVALRILPSSHTNPIFVLVDGKPVRASKRSVEWCLKGVDQCWSQKERFIKAGEMEEAKNAYAHARVAYQKILGECERD